MDRKRLAQLIEFLQAGKLSRNRHFDAHCTPEVREARARQLRLKALAELIVHDSDDLDMQLAKEDNGAAWVLNLKAHKWRLRWQARLLDVEVDWLRNNPQTSHCMKALVSAS